MKKVSRGSWCAANAGVASQVAKDVKQMIESDSTPQIISTTIRSTEDAMAAVIAMAKDNESSGEVKTFDTDQYFMQGTSGKLLQDSTASERNYYLRHLSG